MASLGSNKKVIKYLHSQNDRLIQDRDLDGCTAVSLACLGADLETLILLENLGADINQLCEHGRNGLLCAAWFGKNDIIKYLHAQNNDLIHAKDVWGDTAVTIACKWADLKTVKLLEKLGAKISETGEYNRTPLEQVKKMCLKLSHDF